MSLPSLAHLVLPRLGVLMLLLLLLLGLPLLGLRLLLLLHTTKQAASGAVSSRTSSQSAGSGSLSQEVLC